MNEVVLLAFVLVLLSTALFWGSIGSTMGHADESDSYHGEGKFAFGNSNTIWVPDNFTSIQEAINNASGGDTVFVGADTYYETVIVNKSISLIGEDRETTIIEGNGTANVATVVADSVVVTGFTIRLGDYGIMLNGSCSNMFVGNTVTNNTQNGVNLRSSSNNNTFVGNTVNNTRNGINVYKSSNNTFVGNTVTNSTGDCVNLRSSSNNNTFVGNTCCFPNDARNGINVYKSNNNTFVGNTLANKRHNGVNLADSSNNTFIGNTFKNNSHSGINVYKSSNNTFVGNTVTNNTQNGVNLSSSSNNTFYHNNFVNNTQQAYVSSSSLDNIWDDGYPLEGNYWGNYTGVDMNHDGIGDSPHIVDGNNTDNRPLMGMFHSFMASPSYSVNVVSNSTIGDFAFFESNGTIRMYVSSSSATQSFGFCRVCIPKGLIAPDYTVAIESDGMPVDVLHFNDTIHDNSTHRWIYFAYEHSTHKVEIIPESPTWTSILLTVILLTVATAIYKQRQLKTPIH